MFLRDIQQNVKRNSAGFSELGKLVCINANVDFNAIFEACDVQIWRYSVPVVFTDKLLVMLRNSSVNANVDFNAIFQA